MDNETDKILNEQLRKLPREIVTFISSTNWGSDVDDIGSLYNLSKEENGAFEREVTLVLAGIVHPNEFHGAVEQEVGLKGEVLDALVANVEKKIFAPIRPALIEFFEKEAVENTEALPKAKEVVAERQRAQTAQMSDVAPDNLPTGETESFLPNLAPKTNVGTEGEVHPFEEKMKRVFTAGQQSMGDLAIEPSPQATAVQSPKAPPVYKADPYREAIE